mgnify:CR=1|jgi:tRNA G18 (ribose-2'-O)-methylase SpoU
MNEKLSLSGLNRIGVEEFKQKKKNPIIIVLDNVRSMNNVGSVFRTSDAFLIEKIFLCGITPKPPHRDIQKTALGATETVDWEHKSSTLETIEELKTQGYIIYSIEQTKNSIMLNDFSFPKGEKIAIVFGNEVDGVSQEVVNLSSGVIEIPQFGTKHSLNISVSAGIVIWELINKLNG